MCRYNIPIPGSEPRYVALPGEDSVFGDVYGGSDAYVKFDILSTAEPQYHYPNLETTSKGWVEDRHSRICLYIGPATVATVCTNFGDRLVA